MEPKDICQICKQPEYKSRLVWRRAQYHDSAKQNYLAASEYNTTDWSTSLTVEYTAWGLYPDERRPQFDSSYNVTWLNGLAAFDGSGTVRTVAGIDVSGWTSLTVSAYVGHHQLSTTPELAITIGICSEDGLTTQVLRTLTRKGQIRIWGTVTPAEITAISTAAVCVYITVAGTGLWWFERAQLEKDVSEPGRPCQSAGTALGSVAATDIITMAKVCPACREKMSHDPMREAQDAEPSRIGEWMADENQVEV